MARYTEAVCRQCRREGKPLLLKGDRCFGDKCSIKRRASAPGQHGNARKKLSEYAIQLREKQKVKRFYGVLEKQFRKYFYIASKQKGITGENLLKLLERRFDNVIYRIGLAGSRKEARQLVTHEHFTINGKKVNIPSYILKVGDIISLKESSRESTKFASLIELAETKAIPEWIEFDVKNLTAKIVNIPSREDIDLEIKEHLIVELYSK